MYSTDEEQFLISASFAERENRGTTIPDIEKAGTAYFASYKMDWAGAIDRLKERKAIVVDRNDVRIDDSIDTVAMTRRRPRYKYWYNDWYRMAKDSLAHSRLCEHAYGIDLCQTGMMTKNQIDYLCGLPGIKGLGLDVGCGLGRITEYISSRARTSMAGIDTILTGVKAARERTVGNEALTFVLGDMRNYVVGTDTVFDFVISMDTLYFLGPTFPEFLDNAMKRITTGGTMFVFYSAWTGKDQELGAVDNNLGRFLEADGSAYTYTDFTEDDCAHWDRKRSYLNDSEPEFAAEGNGELHRRRQSEADFFDDLARNGKMKRYLYSIQKA